jgi:hypothetical protein
MSFSIHQETRSYAMSDTKQVTSLTAKVITTIVTALAESITAAKNSADSIKTFCTAAAKAGFPKTPTEPDVVAVADELSKKLGWNGTPREKVSKSEARSIIRQHALLPEAITAVRSATGSCGYHDAVKIARLIKEHGNVGDAVIAMTTKKEAAKTDPQVAAARGLKTWYNAVRDGSKGAKRTKLMSLIVNFANECELDIGLGG